MEYEFVPVDVIRWHVLDISIDGLACVGDLIEEAKAAIGGLARASDGRSCAVRIRLFGRGPVHHQLVENGEAMDLVSAGGGAARARGGGVLGGIWLLFNT